MIGEKALERGSNMLVVLGLDLQADDFLDHGQEVGQGANGREWRRGGRSRQATCGGENERVLRDAERHGAFVKLLSEQPVATSHNARGAGRCAIGIEEIANVLVALFQAPGPQPCGSRSDGPSMRTVWQ